MLCLTGVCHIPVRHSICCLLILDWLSGRQLCPRLTVAGPTNNNSGFAKGWEAQLLFDWGIDVWQDSPNPLGGHSTGEWVASMATWRKQLRPRCVLKFCWMPKPESDNQKERERERERERDRGFAFKRLDRGIGPANHGRKAKSAAPLPANAGERNVWVGWAARVGW